MIEEFNVDSKAECDQINLAHVARKNINETKTNSSLYHGVDRYPHGVNCPLWPAATPSSEL